MKKTKTKTYSLEFKQSSAQLAVDSAQPILQTARDLGVNPTTLYDWVAKFHPNHDQAKQSLADSVNEELKPLRQENICLKQELDLLKKAAACVPQAQRKYRRESVLNCKAVRKMVVDHVTHGC